MSKSENIKIKKTISIYKKEIVLMIIAIGLLLFSLANLIIINYKKNYVPTIMYRTYTKEKGWSKWSKNGEISGNNVNSLKGIKVKSRLLRKGKLDYQIYTKGKWLSNINLNDKKYKDKLMSINGVKFILNDKYKQNYSICYRTYVKKIGWYDWSCDGRPNGNKDKNIQSIEVKIIKKGVLIRDYLKDYDMKKNTVQEF